MADLIIPSPEPAKKTVNPDDVMLRRPEGRNRADMEARARAAAAAAEAQEREKAARAKAEAEANAKAEAERKAKEEAAKAAAEAEAKAKAEAERKAKEEAAKAAAEAEAKAKAEAEIKAKEEAAKAAAEAEAKAKAEAERKAQEEAAKAAAEAEAKAKAERKAKEEAAKAAAEAEAKVKAEAETKKQEVSASGKDKPGKDKKDKKSDKKAKVKVNAPRTGRDAVITSERTDYDRKEGIILFDRNVFVDDEQYQMHADRLFVFLDGTNDLKRIVAIGNVSITNEARTASCSKAVFTKAASKIVMYGDDTTNAKLSDPSQRGGMVEGKKITFWLDAEQVSVEGSVVNLPGGMLKGKDPKKLLEHGK